MLPGRAKMSFRVPSMSTVAKVVGRLRDRNTEQREQRQRLRYQPSACSTASTCSEELLQLSEETFVTSVNRLTLQPQVRLINSRLKL